MLAEDETAAIDMSVGFFAVVLIAFVFAAFDVAPTATPRPAATLGQTTPTVTATPATWNAIGERGGFAVYAGGTLGVLDLAVIAGAILDGAGAAQSDTAHVTVDVGGDDAPNSFAVTLSFVPAALPPAWTRAALVPADGGGGAACLAPAPRLLTVWVADGEPTLAPLLAWAAACPTRLRVETLPPAAASGRVTRAIALDADSFVLQRIFK